MSGGGKQRTGGMSSVVVHEYSEEQIKDLEIQINNDNIQLAKLKEEKPGIEASKLANQKKLQQSQTQASKLRIELESFQQQSKSLESKLNSLNKDV